MLESPITKPRTGGIRLSVKNFGPISRGSMVLKPLTILVGPNGCGKTHIERLLHSILKAEERHIDWDLKDMQFLRPEKSNWYWRETPPSSILVNEAKRIHRHAESGSSVNSDICKYATQVWSKSFEAELRRFPNYFWGNIRDGCEYFEIEVKSEINRGKFVYKDNPNKELQVEKLGNTNLEIKFKKYHDNSEMDSDKRLYRDENTIHVTVPDICDERTVLRALKDGAAARAKSQLNRSVYFPAERSGMTQLMDKLLPKYIHTSTKRRSARSHSRRPVKNVTDKVARTFYWLQDIDEHKGVFAHMAERFEDEALGGSLVLKTAPNIKPHVYFHTRERIYNMAQVASSVRDVALFLTYVKHAARQGDVVILEEPEINLHPTGQMLLARLIARLANGGLYVVVSTHSPYFLEQLSHCIVGGAIRNEKSGRVLPHDECPRIEDVATYQFVPHDGGYEICPTDVTEDGIPQAEFMNVYRKLYDELTSLRQADE